MKLFSWLLGSVRVENFRSNFCFKRGGRKVADKINKKEDEVQGAAVKEFLYSQISKEQLSQIVEYISVPECDRLKIMGDQLVLDIRLVCKPHQNL
jgi:hypothetical protein